MAEHVVSLAHIAGLLLEIVENGLDEPVSPHLARPQAENLRILGDPAELVAVFQIAVVVLELGSQYDEAVLLGQIAPDTALDAAAALGAVHGDKHPHLLDVALRGNVVIEVHGVLFHRSVAREDHHPATAPKLAVVLGERTRKDEEHGENRKDRTFYQSSYSNSKLTALFLPRASVSAGFVTEALP